MAEQLALNLKATKCKAHYWEIDSRDKGVCKLCGAIKDFRPLIDKEFGNTPNCFAKGVTLERPLCNTNGFYWQTGRVTPYGFWLQASDRA